MLTKLNYPFIIGAMRLGKWGANFSEKEYERFIDECLAHGLDCFDHADIYGDYTTEEEFGAVLKKRSDLKQKVKIISKCGIRYVSENRPENKIKSYDTSAEHIRKSVERSLQNLGIECLDMLLIHRPDHLMNPAEIADIIKDLKQEGKLKAFGVSNFKSHEFDLMNQHIPLATNQVELSLHQRQALEDGTLHQCMLNSIRPTIWSPLGGGYFFSDECPDELKSKLEQIGKQYKMNLNQILLKWVLMHPSRPIPILGSTKIERIKDVLHLSESSMSRETWYDLLEAVVGDSVA